MVKDRAASFAAAPAIAAPSEQTHQRARPAHHEAIAVVFDLVHPVGPGWWLGGAGGDAGLGEPVGVRYPSGTAPNF